MKLTYDINERPPKKQNLLFAFQQMIAIMAATLLVPILMSLYGLPSDPAAALFGAGIGTIVYLLFTKFRSPVFLGSTFTFLPAYAASIASGYGYWGVIIGVGLAALTYVVFALVIKAVGSGWVNKLLPASIAGPVVALIGLSLSGTATGWMQTNGGDTYSLLTILVGLLTFFAIVLSAVKGNKRMKLFPFIYGIGAGYILSLILTLIGKATGSAALQILSFDSFHQAFDTFRFTSILDIPKFYLLRGIQTNGQFAPIDGTTLANLAVVYVPIAVVDLAQHIGDHKNLGNIVNRDLITDPGLDRTILGDGIGSFVGTVFGSCANTTYGESIACTAITGNASTHTILTASVGCMLLAFFTPFVALINSIPKCVMGGACVALYGYIAVSGLQLISKVDLGDARNLYPVAAILVCGIGGLTLSFGHNAEGGALISFTSLAVAMFVGILTKRIVGEPHKADSLGASIKTLGEVEFKEEEK